MFRCLVLAIATAAAFTAMPAQAQSADATKALNQLFADEWERSLVESPESASYQGDTRFNDRWSDNSLAAIAKREAEILVLRGEIAALQALLPAARSGLSAAQRKLKDAKPPADVAADVAQQLQRLVTRRFLVETPHAQLQHLPRYLKAVQLRLDKLRADPARDAAKLAELKPQDQRYWRLVAERKGVQDARLQELRWLLEELRVSFFAQELRTPQPVSLKRLDKSWAQLNT